MLDGADPLRRQLVAGLHADGGVGGALLLVGLVPDVVAGLGHAEVHHRVLDAGLAQQRLLGPVLGLVEETGLFLEFGGGEAGHIGEGVVAEGGLGVALAVELEHQVIPLLLGHQHLAPAVDLGLDVHLLEGGVDLGGFLAAHAREDDPVAPTGNVQKDRREDDQHQSPPHGGEEQYPALLGQVAPKVLEL